MTDTRNEDMGGEEIDRLGGIGAQHLSDTSVGRPYRTGFSGEETRRAAQVDDTFRLKHVGSDVSPDELVVVNSDDFDVTPLAEQVPNVEDPENLAGQTLGDIARRHPVQRSRLVKKRTN